MRVTGKVIEARLFRAHDRRWVLTFIVRVEDRGVGVVRVTLRGRSAKDAAFAIYAGVLVSVEGPVRHVEYVRAQSVTVAGGERFSTRQALKRREKVRRRVTLVRTC